MLKGETIATSVKYHL